MWPAHVECLADPDGSRPVPSDRLDNQPDDQARQTVRRAKPGVEHRFGVRCAIHQDSRFPPGVPAQPAVRHRLSVTGRAVRRTGPIHGLARGPPRGGGHRERAQYGDRRHRRAVPQHPHPSQPPDRLGRPGHPVYPPQPGEAEKDRSIRQLEERRRGQLPSLGVRTATSFVELPVWNPATRQVLESKGLDPGPLGYLQDAIKSNANFALVRRWRCLSGSSPIPSNGSHPAAFGNGHRRPTVTTQPGPA